MTKHKTQAYLTPFLSICLLLLISSQIAYATLTKETIQKRLDAALQYKYATSTDSATILLEQLIEELKAEGTFDAPLTLEARLHLVERKLNTSLDFETAAGELHRIMDAATAQQAWRILADAKLVIAYLYYLTDKSKTCLTYLAQVADLIKKHNLEVIYPKYAARKSTIFRRFTSDRDSVIYYANESLKYAADDEYAVKAEAYFSLGRMARYKTYEKSIDFYRKAVSIYKRIGNEEEEVYMTFQIGEAYYRLNQLDSANYYLDLAKNDFNKVSHLNLYRIYLFKARIKRQLGEVDSAWYFLNLSYEAQFVRLNQEKREAVAEVEESYQNAKKNRQLEQQQQALQLEKTRRNWFIIIAFVLALFTAVLVYLYAQLRTINKINRQQAEQLKNLDQVKSRFFANVSHELRTPLTLMLGPVNHLLKQNHLTSKQADLLQTAADSGAQLQQLINEILDLRKLEMNKMEIQTQPTVLSPFFIQYITQFDSLAVSKRIDFSYEVSIDEDVSADIDQEKMRQILQNLLSNAFKYTPAEEQIKVQVRLEKQQLQLVVADTGRGIHQADLPYIFDRYFQTNQRERAMEGGTGIGLALCKEYIELLGGKIQVASKLNQGTTFRVSLPVTIFSTPVLLTAQNAISTIPSSNYGVLNEARTIPSETAKKPRLLVVEDQQALANYLQLLLSEQYEVVTAENGQKAWDCLFPSGKAQTRPFDLILSDLMMPVMDGYQLLEKLKNHDATRHIPIVMLTARAELRDKLKALRIGVDDYLIKPFEEEELLVRIENLLQNQTSRQLETATSSTTTIPAISEEDQKWLVELEQFVQKNLSNNVLSVSMIATQFAISEPTLFRQMKRITGLSPAQYLKEVRLEKALRLLENRTYNSIAKVAYEVGYTDPNSFSRAFKRRFGKSPSKIINN